MRQYNHKCEVCKTIYTTTGRGHDGQRYRTCSPECRAVMDRRAQIRHNARQRWRYWNDPVHREFFKAMSAFYKRCRRENLSKRKREKLKRDYRRAAALRLLRELKLRVVVTR